jgi:PKD repeat protein
MQQKRPRQHRRKVFRLDALLLVFLVIGWSLIFTTATWGLSNNDKQWLPFSLVSKVAADYSAAPTTVAQLARINPEIVEAVKKDLRLRATPTPAARTSATATLEPTFAIVTGLLAVSAGGPYNGHEGSSISVTAEYTGLSLGLVPGAITYQWDTDNDGQFDDAEGQSASVTFYDDGDYRIRVQGTDLFGRVATDTATVSVSNVPPFVTFKPNAGVREGEETTFVATATDPGKDLLLYEWDFGDDSPKVTDTLNPRHTFGDNGTYRVSLRVSDNDGGVTEVNPQIVVANLPPVVDAGPDQVMDEAGQVTFKGTATDPGVSDTLNYAWDLDYNGRNFNSDVSGQTASMTYPNGPATHMVALRVRDKDGAEAIDTLKVTVKNVPPVIASFTNNSPADEGAPISLTVAASDVGNDLLTYSFDWEGDGDFDAVEQSNTVSHIWNNQGSYTARVRVNDGDGGETFATTTVSTLNAPPIAIANVDPVRREGETVTFDGTESSDPGVDDLLTYQWNFGDGNSAAGQNTTHIYGDNGVYSATLTVTDDSGASSIAALPVTVLNANPTAAAGSDQTVDEGTNVAVAFAGSASDPGSADQLELAWDFDYRDGTFTQDALGTSGTYTYPALDGPAEHQVALRVKDDDYPFPTDQGGEIGEALSTFRLTVNNVPPWNVRGGGPYTGVETVPIILTGSADDAQADLPTLAYAWDLDNNPLTFEETGNQVSQRWNRAGNYTVRLRVTDKDGGESFASAQVTIENARPDAEANGPYTSTIIFPITFSAAGSSDPTDDLLSYEWNFGDGTPPVVTSSITVTHQYSDDGVFTATLRVDDGRGGTDTAATLVFVENQRPTAVARANPEVAPKRQPINFNGSESTDPDDRPSQLTYEWDFGDGNTATGVDVTYAYTEARLYTVTLRVTDDNGARDTASVEVRITNGEPVAQAGDDRNAVEGEQVTFNGRGIDPDNDPLIFEWDFNYDGNNFDIDASGETVTTIFPNGPATVTVALRVRDGNGGSNIDTLKVNVSNAPPIADAGGNQSVLEGDDVNLNGSNSTDPGSRDTLTFEWDFNYDGNTFNVDASGQNVTTSYPDGPATYTVTLRVTDSDGASHIDSAEITVRNAPPSADAGPDQMVSVGELVTLDAGGSSDPAGQADPLTFAWDLDNDGNPDVTGESVTYTWTISDSYTIMLRVTDDDGDSDEDTVTIQVN